MAQTETLYILEIKIPDEDSKRVPVQGKISIGSSEDVDICIEDFGLAPRHCTFRDNNEILTVQNTGGDGAVIVGKQKLSHGKMYIVDKGDSIKLGELTFVVRTEEVEAHYVEEDEKTLAGQDFDEDDYDDDETEGKPKSLMSRFTGMFKRNRAEDLNDPEEEEPGEIEVIDHSDEEDEEYDDDSTAPREVKASGAIGSMKPKKVRISPFLKEKRAGFIIRLLGFILNLCAIYSIYLYALPLLKVEAHFQKIFDLLTPHIEKVLPLLTPHVPEAALTFLTNYITIKILILFILTQIVSSLLFGCSLGLFLLGGTGNGGFVGKRIKSLVRNLIGFITSPLLIFDLPILLKYRTLKEVLSHSQIEKRSNALSFLAGVTIFPIALIAAFLWPLINDPILLKMPEYVVSAPAPRKKAKTKAEAIVSSHFELKAKYMKKKSLELIPSFEKKGIILHVLDTKKGSKLSISKSKSIDLNPEFKSNLESNPFFASFTPNLFKFMSEQKASKEVNREISAILRDSIGMDFLRLHEILLDHGPYVKGLIDIRLKALSSLGITEKYKSTLYTVSRKDFLILEEESTAARQRIVILPLNGMKLTPIQIEFRSKDRVLANIFVEKFFKNAGPAPKDYLFTANTDSPWNAFAILDLFANKESIDITDDVVASVSAYYKQSIEKLKSPKDVSAKAKRAFIKTLRNSFKRTSKSMEKTKLADELVKLTELLPATKTKKKKE